MEKTKKIKYDAIFCQSFGPQADNPGISNQYLADNIVKIYNKNPKPLIIQKDAADAFPEDIKIDKVISAHETPGKYLDTYEVSRQCAKYCWENNIRTLLVLSHPHQLGRVKMTVEHFGLKTTGVTCNVPYDPKSVQIWTRSPWLFIPREIFVRIAYVIAGKI